MKQLRVTNGRTHKRQAIAMSLRALSPALGTSPASCPIGGSFGYEQNDWNLAARSIPDGDG